MVGINILGQAIKYLILDSQSTTTIIFIQPLLIGRPITKSIKISFYLQSGTGSSFRSPLYALYKALAYQQVYVIGLTRSHVPTRFNVLDPCLRSSRNTYARSPTTPIYTRTQYTKILLYPNVFVLNTHSYAYVAFFNYYPVQYIVFQFVPTSVTVQQLEIYFRIILYIFI